MRIALPALLAAAFCAADSASAQQELTTEVVIGSGVGRPLLVTSPPGEASRLFVVSQWGRIWIVENGVRLSPAFLDINSQVSTSGERGLLGLAFHPDYLDPQSPNAGQCFVNYTDNSGTTVIERFTVDANDPNKLDLASRQVVLTISQPYSNHNGGMVAFGPDGYLYIGTGDGGSGGDPGNRAQSANTLLGKMLRIDVDQLPYSSPSSNMGAQDPNMLDEIWGLGLRNPWRYSFDAENGDLWIADVGQNIWEEVDRVESSRYLGTSIDINFGWRLMEGAQCYNPSSNCNPNGTLELPIFDYPHSAPGTPFRCSITGGYVYRGQAMADLRGTYFFSDYCSGELLALEETLPGSYQFVNFTSQTGTLGSVVGFGEDLDGEVLVCATNGQVRRIVPKGFRLDIDAAQAGGPWTAELTGGAPNAGTGIAFSTVGLGATPFPGLGVTLALAAPRELVRGTTGTAGSLSFSGTVPTGMTGRTVYVQGVQNGGATNVYMLEF